MRFYNGKHRFWCGVDLHARTMYICILSASGETLLHKSVKANPQAFLRAVKPFRKGLVVSVECMFTWYWLADLCEDEGIPFVLGHALYMKAIHGGKTKNDRIDAKKIAALLKGGLFPMAYVYPRKLRATRDLLRRRMHFMRKRAELNVHVTNTNSQYNLPPIGKNIGYLKNREGVAERFTDPAASRSVQIDLELMGHYDRILTDLERDILATAKLHDADALYRLNTVPGIRQAHLHGHPLRGWRHQPLPARTGVRLLLPHDQAGQGVGRQDLRTQRQEDRQRALEVGVLRGRVPLSAEAP
jgi:Transposase